jgi:hypothetical protein
MKILGLGTLATGSLLLLSGCGFDSQERLVPLVDQPVSIEAGTADRANVELDMTAGELRLSGGASKLLEGTLEYNETRFKPRITSSTSGAHATVTLRQSDAEEGSTKWGGNAKNTWDLQLADKTLLDLSVNCGAGQAKLNLGDVLLRSLQVQIGVGQVDLDLTGNPKHDYEVNIHGGIGQASIHLPTGVGVYATAHGGLDSINVTGLQKEGDHWQNDLYDKAKVNVKIEVNGGIGEIRLIG